MVLLCLLILRAFSSINNCVNDIIIILYAYVSTTVVVVYRKTKEKKNDVNSVVYTQRVTFIYIYTYKIIGE